MKRGTRVGQAYIAVSADGDGINEDIVRDVEKSEPGVEESGDRAGKGWRERFSDSAFGSRLDDLRNKVADRLRVSMGDAGDEAGKEFSKGLGDGVDNDTLSHVGDKVGEDFAKHFLDSLESRLGGGSQGGPLAALFDKLMTEAENSVSGNGRNRKGSSIADKIGALFGAGSRNNFLNVLGNSIGGIVSVVESATNAVTGLFTEIVKGSEEGEQSVSLMSRLGSGIASLAASGPVAAAALIAVGIGMTLLVSLANALLAAVVALAATIASALVGALAIGGAGMLAMASAVGLTLLAYKSLTDAQKTLLKDAFTPLHQEVVGLGQVMLEKLIPAFSQWSENLQTALGLVSPLAAVMGGALAHAGDVLTAAFSGPGFQLFLSALSSELPGILTSLTVAFGGFLNGALSIFAVLLPVVEQFADHLGLVGRNFQAWAASAQGQNAIVDFVNRALTSLNSLWNLVKAVGGLLATVLFNRSGQAAGNGIFDSLTKSVQRFTHYLSTDNRLDKWFAEGESFAKALGATIVVIVKLLQKFNSSDTLAGLEKLVGLGESIYNWFDGLPNVLQNLVLPLKGVADLMGKIASLFVSVQQSASDVNPQQSLSDLAGLLNVGGGIVSADPTTSSPSATPSTPPLTIPQLQDLGATALAGTNLPKVPPGTLTAAQLAYYQNLADSIIKAGPTMAAQIRTALNNVNKTITNALTTANKNLAEGIRSAATSSDAAGVASALQNLVASQSATIKNTIETLRTNAANLVTSAQGALNNAAEQLKSATTQKQADAALAAIAKAQKQLDQAEKAQKSINAQTKRLRDAMKAANAIIAGQGVLTQANANALANGLAVVNATLADYADARAQVAEKLQAANQKLQEAIALRDNYKTAVTDAVDAFAALTTAQAKTIDGVVQALTATDITTNLQAKLDQIKKFQSNLHILLSEGLSQAAYKQLVDAGVEQGGAFAQALVDGGQGAIAQVDSLTAQIQDIAGQLGTEASDRMYQAGVDAAQGLVDGLTSLSAQLDSAAAKLGDAIAAAVKRALGISSPSKVMFGLMGYTGDGIVDGLDAQHGKVGSAAARLSSRISVSPEVAAYAASQGDEGGGQVSGNRDSSADPRIRDLHVHTPTEDPMAVAHEVLNEVVGRLP